MDSTINNCMGCTHILIFTHEQKVFGNRYRWWVNVKSMAVDGKWMGKQVNSTRWIRMMTTMMIDWRAFKYRNRLSVCRCVSCRSHLLSLSHQGMCRYLSSLQTVQALRYLSTVLWCAMYVGRDVACLVRTPLCNWIIDRNHLWDVGQSKNDPPPMLKRTRFFLIRLL